jgi:sec-independent protein translocase protein TatC
VDQAVDDSRIDGGARRGKKNPDGRMPFMDHIRELRTRLLKSAIAVVLGMVVGFLVHNWVIHVVEHPVCHISGVHGIGVRTSQCPNGVLTLQGALSPITLTFKVSLVVGLVLAAPVWSYQLWAFLAPALYKNEKRYALGFVFSGVPLFFAGAALCYWIFPTILKVLLVDFTPGGLTNNLPFEQFVGFFLRMVLVFGLSFELPLLVLMLNFLGVLSAARLRHWWRIVVFMIFVFAAAAVPTGEPLGMTLLAAPLCLLYFLAIGIATLNDRRRASRRAAEDDIDPDRASDLDLTPLPVPPVQRLAEVVPVDVASSPVADRDARGPSSGPAPEPGGYDDVL